MAIPQSQLDIWSNRGAMATSQSAYASIRDALTKTGSPLADRNIDIFLQGSYANATNIRADSDIDVVVLYDEAWVADKSKLTPNEIQLYDSTHVESTYKWQQLRDDTIRALQQHFGAGALSTGTKAIRVATRAGSMTADVVPAFGFKRYATFVNDNNCTGWWGIQFWDSSSNPIVNFPKWHINNGEEKNQDSRTAGRYKPTIRLFKNFRNCLVDKHRLAEDIAPSYFLEGMLYNVPDEHFMGSFDETVPTILDYLWSTAPDHFWSQNGVVPLFGNNSTQWSTQSIAVLLQAMRNGWSNWGNW
jgi:hypothetical protein